MEKLWSVNNELLGTAHKNRYGAIVDFRPATVQVEGKKILVVPAKGVRVEKLRLEPDEIVRVEIEVNAPLHGVTSYKEELRKEFLGSQIAARSSIQYEWSEEALQKEREERERSHKKTAASMEAYAASMAELSFENIAARVTRRQVERIKSGSINERTVSLMVDRILRDFLAEKFPGILLEGSVSSLWHAASNKICSSGFKELLLERDRLERERRKTEWMSR